MKAAGTVDQGKDIPVEVKIILIVIKRIIEDSYAGAQFSVRATDLVLHPDYADNVAKLKSKGQKLKLKSTITKFGSTYGLQWVVGKTGGTDSISFVEALRVESSKPRDSKESSPPDNVVGRNASITKPEFSAMKEGASNKNSTSQAEIPVKDSKETTSTRRISNKGVSLPMRFETLSLHDTLTFDKLNERTVEDAESSDSESVSPEREESFSDSTAPDIDETLLDMFYGAASGSHQRLQLPSSHSAAIMDFEYTSSTFQDCNVGFLGKSSYTYHLSSGTEMIVQKDLFLNVSEPFCLVCIGVQGAGKSHTMLCALENCMISCPYPEERPLTKLHQKMCGLVLHYDQSPANCCEAIGLQSISSELPRLLLKDVRPVNLVVLVSPTNYNQRKKFYGASVTVLPLLFTWKTLNAQQLRKIMRLNQDDAQLYVSVMLDLLRNYQREDKIPVFDDFVAEITSKCPASGQSGPLTQRLQLLKTMVKESDKNEALRGVQKDLGDIMTSDTLVVCDLTDPLLSADEANGIFQVLLEQFRNKPIPDKCGKVVVFDEAHKYLSGGHAGSGKEELSASIVDTVRLMRHEGIRILVSTQSPMALPSELLELVTITVLHQFQSADWYGHLSSKIPLPRDGFDIVQRLVVGEALVVSSKIKLRHDEEDEEEEEDEEDDDDSEDDEEDESYADDSSEWHTTVSSKKGVRASIAKRETHRTQRDPLTMRVHIRKRITKDYGSSRLHKK